MPTTPSYLTPRADKWLALLEFRGLSDRAKVLLFWLVFSADPRTGRVGFTYTQASKALSWDYSKVRRAMTELLDSGMVRARVPRGPARDGWAEVVSYYEVMQMTRWLAKQRGIGS